ncbi:MAG TPA: hypothetical protein VMU94_07460 [Streptosporangiaceae bacterium]|nr:hypothetical protein [Streptosporangiaceae bacterium]
MRLSRTRSTASAKKAVIGRVGHQVELRVEAGQQRVVRRRSGPISDLPQPGQILLRPGERGPPGRGRFDLESVGDRFFDQAPESIP